jgi:hypothetical protein
MPLGRRFVGRSRPGDCDLTAGSPGGVIQRWSDRRSIMVDFPSRRFSSLREVDEPARSRRLRR